MLSMWDHGGLGLTGGEEWVWGFMIHSALFTGRLNTGGLLHVQM
jgi:hypothetical protein